MAFARKTLDTWGQLRRHAKHGWVYRGHRCIEWALETSLDRYFKRQRVAKNQRATTEQLLIREFKRGYHDFGHHVPPHTAHLEWLALMQHHGAPTRALDFTYSVYVAAYFAMEHSKGDCAVWAINARWAAKQSARALMRAGKDGADRLGERWQSVSDEEMVQPIFMDAPHVLMACPLNPFLMNERLRAQQGAFLIPGDVAVSFADNLEALDGSEKPSHVYRLRIPSKIKRQAMRDLFHMNVTRASLFPGLDGYAQMLAVHHPTVVDPIQWK